VTKDIPGEKEAYDDDNIQRDLELENIAGNLMIAEYQVDKLMQRLTQQIRDIRYHSFSKMKSSSHTFKYNGKWYKLSVKLDELSQDNNNDPVIAQD
jgi:hypothetical protein